MDLTEADKHALSRMPVGRWIAPYDLHFGVRRPYWRLNRLADAGYIQRKRNPKYRGLEAFYNDDFYVFLKSDKAITAEQGGEG